jgi:hypothetical protein
MALNRGGELPVTFVILYTCDIDLTASLHWAVTFGNKNSAQSWPYIAFFKGRLLHRSYKYRGRKIPKRSGVRLFLTFVQLLQVLVTRLLLQRCIRFVRVIWLRPY